MKSVFSGSSSRVRTMYTRCSEREACPLTCARACTLASSRLARETFVSRDFSISSVYLLTFFLCIGMPRAISRQVSLCPVGNDYKKTTEILPMLLENDDLRIATIRLICLACVFGLF